MIASVEYNDPSLENFPGWADMIRGRIHDQSISENEFLLASINLPLCNLSVLFYPIFLGYCKIIAFTKLRLFVYMSIGLYVDKDKYGAYVE